MAILAMSRRAILALPPWLGKPTGKMPVVLMGKMPMLRFYARANIAANGSPTDAQKYVAYKYLGASMETPRPPAEPPASPRGRRKIKLDAKSNFLSVRAC
jgi:hypothetical protein